MNKYITLIEKTFDITLSNKQIEQLELFAEYLTAYNTHTNLVSSNDINLIWDKHIIDSLYSLHYLDNNKNYNIVDIGSGGGFPVIPLSIVLNNSKIIAVDSTKKKTTFLTQAIDAIKLNNLAIINERAEVLAHNKDYRETFDIATARAVGNLAQISELCLPFLKQSGQFLAYKSVKVDEEIIQAENTLNIIGGKVKEIFEYNLKLNENYKRNLVLIEKINNTPEEYPRAFSTIKNKTL